MLRTLSTAILLVLASFGCDHSFGARAKFGEPRDTSLPIARELEASSFAASAQRHIESREYWASETRNGLQAPNRRHGLRTWFESTGVRVHDRTAGGSPRLVELRLAGLGRGLTLDPVAPGEVSHRESRVEIRRAGIVEWYENSAQGLEQGFELAKRPAGLATDDLVVELAVTGAAASARGDAIALTTEAGRKLGYGKLVAVDSRGQLLAAHMVAPSRDRIQLRIDDAEAAYPIVIDPLLTETADAQLESNQANTGVGYGLSAAGDVNGDGFADVLVGAPGYDEGETDEGAAFLFLGGPGGIADGGPLGADAVLTSNQAGVLFGASIAAAGDVNGDGFDDVVVGSRQYDNGQSDEGAAFIFHGSAIGLVGTDPSKAAAQFEGDQDGAWMGFAVAGAGDVNGDGYGDVVVAAPQYDNGHTDEGAVFVFHGGPTGIPDGNPLTAATQLESNQTQAFLGYSVDGAGDVNGDGFDDVIAGAHRYDGAFIDEGIASLFLGSAGGIADGSPTTAHANFRGNQANAEMGVAVAGAGDVTGDGYADVITLAPGLAPTGAASLWRGSAAGIPGDWNPNQALDGICAGQSDAYRGDQRLGTVGDLNGDGYADIAVGAYGYDDDQPDEGGVFIFFGEPNGISENPNCLTPADADHVLTSNQTASEFGVNVTGAGDVDGDGFADLLVGASGYDAGESNEGAAFVYRGGAEGIRDGNPATAHAVIESDQGTSGIGWSVSSAGDVNGDGHSDVIVGAPAFDNGESGEGAAFIFLGSPAGIANGTPATAHSMLESNQTNALFGFSVSAAGDVNGDGYGDVVAGAPTYDNGQIEEGAAFVFLGSPAGITSGTPATAHSVLESDQTNAQFGFSVSSAGDVNGDGHGDVIVGSPRLANGQQFEGAAFLFLGSPSGIAHATSATANSMLESDQVDALFGHSVSSAGDVNGDGYGDVIVGSRSFTNGQQYEGAAFVFFGSSAGIAHATSATANSMLESDQVDAQFGYSVSSAGDVNGDGYSDVIVGSALFSNGQQYEGGAFVFLGSPAGIADGTPASANSRLESDQVTAQFGYSVSSAGDVNGDGYGDVIVGSLMYTDGQQYEGGAFVFLGSPAGIADGTPSTAHSRLEANQTGADFGISVSSAGDVNGDSFSDLIVGSINYDDPEPSEGAAFVFLGNSSGRPTLPRQRNLDPAGTPVQPWGSVSPYFAGFRVDLRGSHPAGVGRVRAEVEACPAGTAFGQPGCSTALSSAWQLLVGGTNEALLTTTVAFPGPIPSTLFRWRARVLYANATGPLPANPLHGPWRRLGGQSVEGDIRLPEPGMLPGLAAGIASLAALRLRRRSRAPASRRA